MKKNIGKIDKSIRIIIGLALIAYGIIEHSYLGLIGLIPLITALVSWCPLYCPLSLSTSCKNTCNKS